MRKKQLLEQLAALRTKKRDHEQRLELAATTGEPVKPEEVQALHQMDNDEAAINAELKSIEELEARVKARATDVRETAQVHDLREDRPFASPGDFLRSVALASMPGNDMDPRLRQFAPTGSGETVPSDGGFRVGQDVAELMYNRGFQMASVASRCSRRQLSSPSGKLVIPYIDETSRANGSRYGGVRVYRRAEADSVTAAKPKYGRLEIEALSMMGLWYVTEELLQDVTALEQEGTQAFSDEFSFKLDDEIINGNGVGQCEGVLNASALISVSKESGQAAATIEYENLVKMYTRMPIGNRTNAVWYINQDIEPQLMTLVQVIGTGGVPVYLPPGGVSAEPYGRIFGRPVIPIEHCATLGTVGDIILADMSQYVLVEKGGIAAAQSMHVRFLYNEMSFRWTARIGGKPRWRSAITPFKGTSTVSPFIALATRA